MARWPLRSCVMLWVGVLLMLVLRVVRLAPARVDAEDIVVLRVQQCQAEHAADQARAVVFGRAHGGVEQFLRVAGEASLCMLTPREQAGLRMWTVVRIVA